MSDTAFWLVAGSYLFTCLAFGWAWTLYTWQKDEFRELSHRVDDLWERVTNLQAHQIAELDERVRHLEGR